MPEVAQIGASLAETFADLAEDRVFAFIVDIALIKVLEGLSSVDVDVRCAAVRQVCELSVDDAVDDRGHNHGLRLEVIVRDRAWDVSLLDTHVFEAHAERFAELE